MSTVTKYPYCKPELWGGIECTINRVNDTYRDQLSYAGHYQRADDIAHFARLGISKIRYPILWEKHEPAGHSQPDWGWTRQQLQQITDNNMIPIAGLLHHGSGPANTDLADPAFPEKFAGYAARVATEFPWLEYYTPINEPLTTARFSGLYGFWYPHKKSQKSFAIMLLNQMKATILAMREIRKINPGAKLVQTEDLAKTHSSSRLAYQARYENERRWLTFDLLTGRFNSSHYFWKKFKSAGVPQELMLFFTENACPPDIIGFNYYVTSERFLDENISSYPGSLHGGNGRHAYVDTEAVRAGRSEGLRPLLLEAWKRYRLPMAMTENHLSCTREEQLRWFRENYETCCQLCSEGIDIRGVTAWSLIGAFDWNSLLTRNNGYYESGVFDIQNNQLRPTALAKLIRELAAGREYDHPLVHQPGWWHRKNGMIDLQIPASPKSRPLLIIGKNGTLGHAFTRICELRSIPYVALGRADLNILNENDLRDVISRYKPWAVVNAAGYVRVDDAEANREECFAINTAAPAVIARVCHETGIRMMSFSSDLVFDGTKGAPYHESDRVMPLNVYGESKAEGEKLLLDANANSLIIRTSAFFGPWDRYNFAFHVIEALKRNESLPIPDDVYVSPTYVPDLVNAAMDLFIDEEDGIWHISNTGNLSWADFANDVAQRAGYSNSNLNIRHMDDMGWIAKRPRYSVLQSGKGLKLPTLDHALERYFREKTA